MRKLNCFWSGKLMAALMVVALTACGGGGGGSTAADEPVAPAPAPAPAPEPTAASMDEARSLSPHYIEVRFDQPVAEIDLKAEDFSLVAADGEELSIMEIAPGEDGEIARLVVSPGFVEPLGEYSLSYLPDPEQEIRLIGDPTVEPQLQSVVTLSTTELLLSFDSEMGLESLQNLDAYIILPYVDDSPDPDAAPLAVTAVEMLDDGRRVILTTGPQDNRQYRVVVKNISNTLNTFINPERADATIVGMGEDDTNPPEIINAAVGNSNELSVDFSEPVCRTGGSPGNYTVEYCAPAPGTTQCSGGADRFQAFVNEVELNAFCTGAILTTSFIPEGSVVSVNVSNVIDNTGNVLNGSTEILPQPSEEAASARPRLASAIALNSREVLLTFDTRLSPEGADNTSFYRIIAAENGSPRIELGELTVSRARLQEDGRTVLLTTSAQEVREYVVRATNLRNAPGEAFIDPEFSSRVFFGRGSVETDTTPPSVTRVSRGGIDVVYVEFSEPLCDTAEDETRYRLSYCLPVEGTTSCSGDSELPVTRVALNAYCTRAEISTSQIPGSALVNLRITGLGDSAGNALVGGNQSFSVAPYVAPELEEEEVVPAPPVVVGAISTGNSSIRVVFSQAMDDSAELASSYAVAQQNVNGEAGSLVITGAAFTGPDRTAVELTTLSQNDVSYQLTVVDVRDSFGQSFRVQATNMGFVTANTATFAGTPPGGPTVTDTDGDGLADNEEQRGWLVTITLNNGQVQSREVSSDPFLADTDDDGLSDRVERGLNTDPRNRDTDGDGLADAHEYNGIFSDPTHQDSDGDGLADGEEVTFYKTSPLLRDTDGDQILDDQEVVLANRDARIADLPQPVFEIESINLELDVRFDETTEQGTTVGDTETVASTLTQSNSRTRSRTSEVNDTVSASITAKTQYELGGDATVGKLTVGLDVTAGYEHSWSSSWSDESTRASQEEYNESLESSREFSEGSSVSRVVESARISTLLYLSAAGDVAFTLRDLQITALVDDIRNPGEYVPVATLVPAESTPNVFNLGPLVNSIGPLIFSSREVFPAQIERLMQNPSGVIFKISNYNIEDESERNFAFSSQEVTDRTTSFSLDFGGEPPTEYYRVATSFGRTIGSVADEIAASEGITPEEVRRNYGLAPDDDDSLIAYDPSGRNLGVVFHDVMEGVLGLTRYDAAGDNANASEQFRSYATEIDGNGVERVTRVRQQRNGERQNWSILSPSGLILGGQLSFGEGDIEPDDQVLFPGTGISLAFVQDLDGDLIPARLEALHGCSDDAVNSDGDGLDDYFEVFGEPRLPSGGRVNPANVWTIELVGAASYEGFSSCSAVDTDGDGLDDTAEYRLDNGSRTDAKKRDTDDDGLTDREEIEGFVTYLEDTEGELGSCEDYNGEGTGGNTGLPLWSSDYPDKRAVLCTTDPLNRDSDGDGIRDGTEPRFFANPTIDDFDDVGDLDGDGLAGFEETRGWDVTVTQPFQLQRTCSSLDPGSFSCSVLFNGIAPTSDPANPDTDADGVRDDIEFAEGTHPRVADSDDDGLNDLDEILGETLDPENGPGENNTILIGTDPLHWDTDRDELSDGDEIAGWEVSAEIVGEGTVLRQVYSDPLVADLDGDGLSDRQERTAGTDPNLRNTDEDKYDFADGDEPALGLDATVGSDVCLKARLTTVYCQFCNDKEVDFRVFNVANDGTDTLVFGAYEQSGPGAEGYVRMSSNSRVKLLIDDIDFYDTVDVLYEINDRQDRVYTINDFSAEMLSSDVETDWVESDGVNVPGQGQMVVRWNLSVVLPSDVVDGETYCSP